MKTLICTLLITFFSYWAFAQPQYAFTTVHCDPQEDIDLDLLTSIVNTANYYKVPLTIELSAPWVDLINSNISYLKKVRLWQSQGHEIGGHHHDTYHGEWDGYTNDSKYFSDPDFIDTMDVFYNNLKNVCGDSVFLTLCSGHGPTPWIDWSSDAIYQTDGGRETQDAFSEVTQEKLDDYTVCRIDHAMLESTDSLNTIKSKFYTSTESVIGIVFHPFNYTDNASLYKSWFKFIAAQKAITRCLNVRSIIRESSCDPISSSITESASGLSTVSNSGIIGITSYINNTNLCITLTESIIDDILIGKINLYDLNGKCLKTENEYPFKNGIAIMDITTLPCGIYLCSVFINQKQYLFKLVKM